MRFRHIFSETFAGLRQNLTMTLAVVMTMWVSLSLFGAGLLANQQVDQFKGNWYDKIEISIFLCTPDVRGEQCEPGQGVTEAQKDTIGAAQLLWLFQAPGGDEGKAIGDAAKAAQHWAGGDLALYTAGQRSALGLALVDSADGGTLCKAVGDWYSAAFSTEQAKKADTTVMSGGDQVGVLRCSGRDVRLGIAPDESSAAALAQ